MVFPKKASLFCPRATEQLRGGSPGDSLSRRSAEAVSADTSGCTCQARAWESSSDVGSVGYGSKSGLWEMESTSAIQQKGPPKHYHPHLNQGIPLHHRSGDKPLDPATLVKIEPPGIGPQILVLVSIYQGNHWGVSLFLIHPDFCSEDRTGRPCLLPSRASFC